MQEEPLTGKATILLQAPVCWGIWRYALIIYIKIGAIDKWIDCKTLYHPWRAGGDIGHKYLSFPSPEYTAL